MRRRYWLIRFVARPPCWGLIAGMTRIGCLWLLVTLLGCGPSGNVPIGEEAENIRQLAVCYMRYIGEHGGKSPKNEENFKKYIARLGYDSEAIEKLLISQRDGKPYRIKYDIAISGAQPIVIAHEEDGVDGVRYVAFDFGGVEFADPDQFRKLGVNE